jgi:hypothetical protein
MTITETDWPSARIVLRPAPAHLQRRREPAYRRPGRARPAAGAVRYHGTGVAMSRAPHRRRPVSVALTVAVAGVAAVITVWLGAIAHSGGVVGTPAAIPQQLAVVRVQAGETLQQLASRVAPGAPVSQVEARIRELNQLDSVALDAGQTLIAPVGPSADHAG